MNKFIHAFALTVFSWFFSVSSFADSAYPCHGCSPYEYVQTAKSKWAGVDTQLYIYDFTHGVYKFYFVQGEATGIDDPRSVQPSGNSAGALAISPSTSTYMSQNLQVQELPIDPQTVGDLNNARQIWLANGGTFSKTVYLDLQGDLLRDWTVYDLINNSSVRNLLGDQLLATQFDYGGVRRTLIWLQQNVAGFRILGNGVSLKEGDTVIFFVVKTADNGRVVYVFNTTNAATSVPAMVMEGADAPRDSNGNTVPTQNSSNFRGTYSFSRLDGLQAFLTHLRGLGIPVSGGDSGPSLECTWDGQTLRCKVKDQPK